LLEGDTQYRGGVWLVVQIGFFDQFCRLRLRRVHASAPKIVNKSADQVRNSEEVKGLMGLGRYREKHLGSCDPAPDHTLDRRKSTWNIGAGFPPQSPAWGPGFIS
jgi:hypothetical protein